MEFSDWHYKRELIAESYFRTIFSGVILSTTVYADSKTGLTNFFIRDLMSCAAANEYSVVYVDLSNKKVPVTAAFLMALDRVLVAGNSANVSFNFFKGLFVSGKSHYPNDYYLNGGEGGDQLFFLNNMSVHLELMEAKVMDILKKNRLLLIFDHAHNLGADLIADEFCIFLRRILVQYRDRLKPIYGTCDIPQWSAIFKNPRSALYSEGASMHHLPVLDRIFVREVMQKSGIRIELDEAVHYFKQIGCKPGIFLAMVSGWSSSEHGEFVDYFNKFFLDMNAENCSTNDKKKESYVLHH